MCGGGSVPFFIFDSTKSKAPSVSELPANWLIKSPLYQVELSSAGARLYACNVFIEFLLPLRWIVERYEHYLSATTNSSHTPSMELCETLYTCQRIERRRMCLIARSVSK